MEYNFNKNWILRDSHGTEKKVDLPYDAMIQEKRQDDCLNGINSGYFPGGKYVYRKEFELTDTEAGQKCIIHFEAVYQNCVITVNDLEVMRHRYGFSSFDADITKAAIPNCNLCLFSEADGEYSFSAGAENAFRPQHQILDPGWRNAPGSK